MSPDRPLGRRLGGRIIGWALLVAVALALLVALAFPWGPISGLAVEHARIAAAPRLGGRLPPGETPERIVVTFSTPVDLARLRVDKHALFINATLSACDNRGAAQRVAVTQAGGIFADGHVEVLPPTGAGDGRRHRYRATFEDWLPIAQGATTDFVSASDIGGGACFSLDGGAMWLGKLWSDRILLHLGTRPPAA